jgi:serine/threonine protein kinase
MGKYPNVDIVDESLEVFRDIFALYVLKTLRTYFGEDYWKTAVLGELGNCRGTLPRGGAIAELAIELDVQNALVLFRDKHWHAVFQNKDGISVKHRNYASEINVARNELSGAHKRGKDIEAEDARRAIDTMERLCKAVVPKSAGAFASIKDKLQKICPEQNRRRKMDDFNTGDPITLANGETVKVMEKLGEGGQGAVYRVSYNGNEYALKWYLPNYLKSMQKKSAANAKKFYENLKSNAASGNPDPAFLWPLMVTEYQDAGFGYIMDLRPDRFHSFVQFLNAKAYFKNTSVVIRATINMVNAFQALHRQGLSYQDLNDGNFFVDPANGDILICDNDNVAPHGEAFGIAGKSRYMAPEVVLGGKPNASSDLFSLSVILFLFYFLSHPLEGKKAVQIPCLTEEYEKKLFAKEPVFTLDPADDTNRPVRGIHNNVIALWPLYPKELQDMFIRAFGIDVLKDPNKRIAVQEWKKAFYRLNDDIVFCTACAEENFASMANDEGITCSECSSKMPTPLFLIGKGFSIALVPDKTIRAWHISPIDGNYEDKAGIVIRNKNEPKLWGLRNGTGNPWIATYPNGEEKTIPNDGTVPILRNVKISFGQVDAEIS